MEFNSISVQAISSASQIQSGSSTVCDGFDSNRYCALIVFISELFFVLTLLMPVGNIKSLNHLYSVSQLDDRIH